MKDFLWGTGLKILKRWSRAGIHEHLSMNLSNLPQGARILSIGGYGPVDNLLFEFSNSMDFCVKTLDIEPNHNPDFLYDIADFRESTEFKAEHFDAIVIIEVLEHVINVEYALDVCFDLLKENAILIGSTPWIIPIHDRPSDYRRLTPVNLRRLMGNYSSIEIKARGNFPDSIITLLLRGLFTGGRTGKMMFAIGAIASFMRNPPKLITEIDKVDSTIGYVFSAVK